MVFGTFGVLQFTEDLPSESRHSDAEGRCDWRKLSVQG